MSDLRYEVIVDEKPGPNTEQVILVEDFGSPDVKYELIHDSSNAIYAAKVPLVAVPEPQTLPEEPPPPYSYTEIPEESVYRQKSGTSGKRFVFTPSEVGTPPSFILALLFCSIFTWIGTILTICFSKSTAAYGGSIAGLGVSIILYHCFSGWLNWLLLSLGILLILVGFGYYGHARWSNRSN
eukprot:m.29890 g.29890  ORF g.29890 m.29890 type:complete len:182 (+) comp31249_c0_seq3:546-1091(+)